MRIAHFSHRYPPALGGAEAYFERLSRYLAAAGDQVTVFTTTAQDLEAFWSPAGRCLPRGVHQESGVEVRRYSLWRWPGRRFLLKALSLLPIPRWQWFTLPCNPIALGMWHDAGRDDGAFDLVHATAFPYAWVIACGLRLARRLGIPFLVTPFLHLGDPDETGDRTRRAYLSPALLALLQKADRVFVQTDVEYQALRQRGFPDAQLVLQGMGVDLADCTGGNRFRARGKWGVDPTDVVVGHLANLSGEKGSIDLLRAADLAWKKGCRFHLVLAGPEMTNFQTFLKMNRPAGPVRCLGALSEEEKRDFFAGLDLFALPSRSDSFGLVFLEAWANGVPNLAYRAGGVPGVIRHGQDGLLVRCGAIEELAEALERLVAEAALRQQLGEAGRQRLAGEFCWVDKLNLVRNQYAKLLGKKKGKR